jgi:hypothetical protein
VQSLNLSVTAAIVLHEVAHQRVNVPPPPPAWQQLYARHLAAMQLQARRGSRSLRPLSESYLRQKSKRLPHSKWYLQHEDGRTKEEEAQSESQMSTESESESESEDGAKETNPPKH